MLEDCLTKMPGIPLVTREKIYSRTADLMCRQDSLVQLSAEEEVTAEESLSIYCKPVELYNILQRRAIDNPLFLQRCLLYKIQAKHKKRIYFKMSKARIQMRISLSGTGAGDYGLQPLSLFPLYILLAKQISDSAVSEYSAFYRFTRACILNASSVLEGRNRPAADFLLPEADKLAAEVKSSSLSILFVSRENAEGHCLMGKLQLDTLYLSWEKSSSFSLGQRAEMMSTVDLHPCFMKPSCLGEDKCISFHSVYNMEAESKQVQVMVSAEELGAKEKSPYNAYTYNGILTSLPHIIRLRLGNVIFNYMYYNNKLHRTEVTEDFSCPFCLVKCASFKGLRYHLSSTHDLFNFEFWVTEECQAINVSVKTDIWQIESFADGVDPKKEAFSFCSKPLRRRKPKNRVQHAKHAYPLEFESNLSATAGMLIHEANDAYSSKGEKNHVSRCNDELQIANLGATDCVEHVASSANVTRILNGTVHPYPDPECVQSLSEGNLAPPAMLQFAKTRKLSVERSDPRNCAILRRRQFFHSHRAQPMSLDQALSDRDSEDEVDDDVADFEDRRMLDDFVDVTKDEKKMMHLWNSFVRKQRVLADGHIPWACEAFSRLHGHDLVRAPALIWCWRLCMIKLWNHGLLDARTMNNCNVILEQFQNPDFDRTIT